MPFEMGLSRIRRAARAKIQSGCKSAPDARVFYEDSPDRLKAPLTREQLAERRTFTEPICQISNT